MTMFHQHSTTFTFSLLKNITKHLFIMQHMVIPFPSHLKILLYTSAPSLSKSSNFLILKFLVKCCKLYSVIKIPSKSHMLDFVLISSVFYKCSCKLWFHSLKVFKYSYSIKSCDTLIIKLKNWTYACSIVSRVFIYASNKPLYGTLIINLGKNWICVCYC